MRSLTGRSVHGRIPASLAVASPRQTLDTPDTPEGLYCKLPQDSPIVVRGARNSPCMGVPGKRAPTVQECYSDKPYTPLAMRQHVPWPYPIDPNLIAQGMPPDERVDCRRAALRPCGGRRPCRRAPSRRAPLPTLRRRRPQVPPPPPPAAEVFPPMDTGGWCRRDSELVRRQRIWAGPIRGARALRSADRPLRHARWPSVSTDRPRRPAQVVAGPDLQGSTMMFAPCLLVSPSTATVVVGVPSRPRRARRGIALMAR